MSFSVHFLFRHSPWKPVSVSKIATRYALPKAVAIQANPNDPVLTEEAIRDGLHKIYEMIQEHREKEAIEIEAA